MADLLNLADVSQLWGNDLVLSPTGDLARATGTDRSTQRVLRRLCTNPGDYITHTEYGAGLPADIGTTIDAPKETAKIKGQMALEATVAPMPAPMIGITAIPNGLSAMISYVTAPEKIPAVLSFNLDR